MVRSSTAAASGPPVSSASACSGVVTRPDPQPVPAQVASRHLGDLGLVLGQQDRAGPGPRSGCRHRPSGRRRGSATPTCWPSRRRARPRRGPGRSNRADMTGQRGPRQAVARPARTIATAPATAAARQGAPAMIDPARPGDDDLVHRAAGGRAARRRAAQRAGQGTGPRRGEDGRRSAGWPARRPPCPRRARPAGRRRRAWPPTWWRSPPPGRPARPAPARWPAGRAACPVTGMSWAGSGRGGVKTACAQAWRAASTTSPAPTAPASSTRTNSLRPVVTGA